MNSSSSPYIDYKFSKESRHPAVFFFNGIGDHITTLPALRALSHIFRSNLTLLCGEGSRDLYFSDLPIQNVVEIPIEHNRSRYFDVLNAAKQIGLCDLFLSLVPWHSSSVSKLLDNLRPQMSVGFFDEYHISLPRDFTKHTIELPFDIPRLFNPGLRLEDFCAPPTLPQWARMSAGRILRHVPKSRRILAIHTDTTPEKTWKDECFSGVVETFLCRHREFIALQVGTPQRAIEIKVHDRLISCVGLPLAISLELVASSDLFLGIDSCMLHIADFFRVPGVGLFGPTNAREFGFRFSKYKHVCSEGNMDFLEVSDVTEALESLINS